jgi:hypothetical protein
MKRILDFFKSHEWAKLTVLFLFCGFILFLRRPDALLNAQFWAEDGKHWYADAYNHGLSATFEIYAGTLQIAMRLIGQLSLSIPLSSVPLFFTVVAISIKIIPVVLLYSNKFKDIVPSSRLKFLIATLYICIPNAMEVHANLTNINWHLAIVSFMLIVGSIPKSLFAKIIECILIIISGLTGPFAIFLAIISAFDYAKRRNKHTLYLAILLSLCAFVQFTLLFTSDSPRTTAPLGVNPMTLLEIFGFRIGGSATFGQDTIARIFRPPSAIYLLFGIFTLTTFFIAYLRGTLQLRLFILLTFMLLVASLLKPIASDTMPQWYALLIGAGSRYFFIPIICFYMCMVFLAFAKPYKCYVAKFYKTTAIFALCVAVPTGFNYPVREDMNYKMHVEEFNLSSTGELTCIPIPPDWEMCLEKK